MNIFLSSPHSVLASVQVLDTKRLTKQALEAYQLLFEAIRESHGIEPKMKHPVYKHYKDNIHFLAYYGRACCYEYKLRTGKAHAVERYCARYMDRDVSPYDNLEEFIAVQPKYTPYYMEGSKNSPECIRLDDDDVAVGKLFKAKLIKKWLAVAEKGRMPNWGKRGGPQFWIDYLKLPRADKRVYWERIEELKERCRYK